MCGLAVEIVRGGEASRPRLEAALGAMAHRGPDGSGVHLTTSGAAGIGMAHARLSVLDLDPRSGQPFRLGAELLSFCLFNCQYS